MAEIVNLRQARKQKARADRQHVAEENRARHGRTLAERRRDEADAAKLVSFVDGHRRDTDGGKR